MNEHSKIPQQKAASPRKKPQPTDLKQDTGLHQQLEDAVSRHQQRTGKPGNAPATSTPARDAFAESRARHQARTVQAPGQGAAPIRPKTAPAKGAPPKAMPILAKLEVGGTHDPLETEADAVAEYVARSATKSAAPATDAPPAVRQRKPRPITAQTAGVTATPVRRKYKGKAAGGALGTGFEQQLQTTKGRGKGLDKTTRGHLESKLDTSLGHVQVHQGHQADRLSKDIGAQAFAHGNDIYFRSGQYQPHTPAGQKLIAHEVWHTLQGQGKVMRKVGGEDESNKKVLIINEAAAQIKQLLGLHLSAEKMGLKLESILQLLYTLDNQSIAAVWLQITSEKNRQKFYELLEVKHYTAFAREIAISLRAFSSKNTYLAKILDKHEKKKSLNKQSLDSLEAARVLFLAQGTYYPIVTQEIPTKTAIILRARREYGYLLDALKSDLKSDYEAFTSEEKTDAGYVSDKRIPLSKDELNTVIAKRSEINAKINQAVADIKVILPQWGATGYTTPILPYQAVKVFRELRKLDDATRDELLKRYPDDFFNVQFNYPAKAKTNYDFGVDPARGASEDTQQYLIDEFNIGENWAYNPDAIIHLNLLLDLAIQSGLADFVASHLESHLSSPILAKDPVVLNKILYILQDAASGPQAKDLLTWESVAAQLIRSDDDEVKKVQRRYLIVDGKVIEKPITTASKAKQSLIPSDYSMGNAILGFISGNNQARKAQKNATRQTWRESVAKAKQANLPRPPKPSLNDPAIHISEPDEIILFALGVNKDPGLVLKDFPLAKLAYHLGGDLMGARLDEKRAQAEKGGLLDATIGPKSASIQSKLIPFSSINYEMGSSLFKSDAATFTGLTGTFDYHDTIVASGDLKEEAKSKQIDAKSILNLKTFEMAGLEIVDGKSFMGVGKIVLQGVRIELNQPLILAGPVTGGFGMNILFAIIAQVNNIMYLAMNTLMTTLDPFMPDAKMFAGQELSDLLVNSFNSRPELKISLESAEIRDIISESSNTIHQVNLGSSTISIGGPTMLEHFKQKADLLASKGDLNEDDYAKQKFYKEIISLEDERLKKHEDEVSCLRKKIQDAKTTEELTSAKNDLDIELRKNRLLVAATLNDLSLVAGDRNKKGEFESMPAPTGRIDFAAELDAPGIGQSDFERADFQLRSALGILDGKDAVPAGGLNRERLYIELGKPQMPLDFNQSMTASTGMNINQLMPGWVGAKLSLMQPDRWKFEAFAPSLRVTTFPTMDGIDFSRYDLRNESYFELCQPKITIYFTFNDLKDQLKKGLVPKEVHIASIEADTLTGDNLAINASSASIYLEKSLVLHGVEITNLRLKSTDGFETYETDTNGFQFRGNKMDVNKLVAGMAIDEIGRVTMDMADYHGENFFFNLANSVSADGLVTTDKMYTGFNKGTGALAEITLQNGMYGLGLGSLEYVSTTTTTHKKAKPTKEEEKENTVNQKIEHHLKVKIGKAKAPNLDFEYKYKDEEEVKKHGDKAKEHVFGLHGIGNTPTPPADLNNIFVDLTVTTFQQETPEISFQNSSPELVGIHVNQFMIESIKGKDFEVNLDGTPLKLLGNNVIDGLFLEDFEMEWVEGRAKIKQLARAGYNAVFFDELVYDMLHLRNFSTGKLSVSKITGQDGFAIGVEDILGEINPHEMRGGKEVSIANAILGGDGMDVSATYDVTNGLLNATMTLKDGITINQLDFKTADGATGLSLAPNESAYINDVRVVLEVKLEAKGAKNPIKYIRLKEYHIGSITAKGLKIKMGGTEIQTTYKKVVSDEDPTKKQIQHDSITILNVNGSNSSYNFLNSKAIVNSTVEAVSGSLQVKMENLLTHPIVDLHELTFGLDKNGRMDIGFMQGDISFPQFDPNAKPGALHSKYMDSFVGGPGKLGFGQLSEVMNMIHAEKTHLIVEKIDPKGDYSSSNMRLALEMQDPQINGLALDLKGKPLGPGMPPLNGRLSLTGQIKGKITVNYQQAEKPIIQIIAAELDDNELSTGKGGIVISDGELLLTDYNAVLPNHKPAPDPTWTEEKIEAIKAENEKLLEDYRYDGKFDIFEALLATANGGGRIGLAFLGENANLEIEDVKIEGVGTKHGYLNLTKAADELDRMVNAFLNTYAYILPRGLPTTELITFVQEDDQVFVKLSNKGKVTIAAIIAALPTILSAIKGGAVGGPGGAYAAGSAGAVVSAFVFLPLLATLYFWDPSIMICDDIGPYGFIERGADQYISIARLVNYQAFKLMLESPDPNTLSVSEQVKDALQTIYGLATSKPFGVMMEGMKFDLNETRRREPSGWFEKMAPKPVYLNRISDLFANEDGDQLKFSMIAGVNGGNNLGPVVKLYDFESGGLRKSGEITTGDFSYYKFDASSLKIGEISVINQDVHTEQIKLKLKDIALSDFFLELYKRKAGATYSNESKDKIPFIKR